VVQGTVQPAEPPAPEPPGTDPCAIEPLAHVEPPACGPVSVPDEADVDIIEPWAEKLLDTQIAALGDPDPRIRETAARVIGIVGPAANRASPSLLAALDDPDPFVRLRSLEALWLLGEQPPGAMGIIEGALEDEDQKVRVMALGVAFTLGRAVCPISASIASLVQSGSPAEVSAAAKALGAIGPPAASHAQVLVDILDHPQAWVANDAGNALASMGGPGVVYLVEALGGGSSAARERAAYSLISADKHNHAAVPALGCALIDDEKRVRQAAAQALVSLIEPGDTSLIEFLDETLRTGEHPLNSAAAGALAAIGAPAVPTLVQVIATADEQPRTIATWSLIGMEQRAESAVGLIADLLMTTEDDDVRNACCHVLAQLGKYDLDVAHAALESGLAIENWQGRWWIPNSLGYLGPTSVELLRAALSDPDDEVRRSAAQALATLGPDAAPAVDDLIELLESQHWRCSEAAAQALGDIGPQAEPAIWPLLEAISAGPAVLSGTAAMALGKIGEPASAAIPDLLAAFEEAEPGQLQYFPMALGYMGVHAASAVKPLMGMLGHSLPEVRENAAWALGQIGEPAHVAKPTHIGSVKDVYLDYNISAIESLGSMGPAAKKAEKVLLEVSKASGWEEPRVAAMKALLSIGTKPKKILATVKFALEDYNPDVRTYAWILAGLLGKDAGPAVKWVLDAPDDSPTDIGELSAITVALGRIGPAAAPAAPWIIERFYLGGVHQSAPCAIKAMGPEAAPAIIDALKEDRWRNVRDLDPILHDIVHGSVCDS
jgi:HEAT repeat protein